MAKDYVARDPRTGLPIATGRQPRKKGTKKQVTGPWQECSRKDILALANGEIPQLQIDWGGRRYWQSPLHRPQLQVHVAFFVQLIL